MAGTTLAALSGSPGHDGKGRDELGGLIPSRPPAPASGALLARRAEMSRARRPESAEPSSAIASSSSATSRTLIETATCRRGGRLGHAHVDLLPDHEPLGRCSPRSRASSERLMKAVRSVPTIFTSMPPSFTSVTSRVRSRPSSRSPRPCLCDRVAPSSCDPRARCAPSRRRRRAPGAPGRPSCYSSMTSRPVSSGRGRTGRPSRRRRR